ncbi:DUF1127 domain-containing protein [Roseomonas terrae]|jgi:uncharacterized protein YjiS (DUF1127 family)|uniref:DUF1127 domain-containing protein n=1 Tax=Neoroseomonas terrae TaxID=424799 RepID=A0ABS5EBA3_9PROT|nr:DUF1127 domain-containing protein [Neoroseomonas terrae]MBR0648296.1 DUF1127 domain-containing protein [Neoroseomonas terrae]
MTIQTVPASLAAAATIPRNAAWITWLRRVLHAAESRRHLAEMDRRMLSDIGISRAEALEEAARAPWDLTARRR